MLLLFSHVSRGALDYLFRKVYPLFFKSITGSAPRHLRASKGREALVSWALTTILLVGTLVMLVATICAMRDPSGLGKVQQPAEACQNSVYAAAWRG